jgi:prepilin-type N-terminal cleavage/methylation domain-containing protein
MSRPRFLGRAGFTLIELLVVIAIIAVLIALLVPAVQKVRESASRAHCANNLRQIGIGLHNYAGQHGALPAAGDPDNDLGWHVYLLPFVEQDNLYRQFDLRPTGTYTDAPGRRELGQVRVNLFQCPSTDVLRGGLPAEYEPPSSGSPPYTTDSYGILGPKGTNPTTGQPYLWNNVGPHGGFALQGVFQQGKPTRLTEIVDGTAHTFALGEISWTDVTGIRYRTWIRGCHAFTACASAKNVVNAINTPGVAIFDDIAFGSKHTRGCHFCMADGSVHFVTQGLDLVVYKALASRNGGEVAAPP